MYVCCYYRLSVLTHYGPCVCAGQEEVYKLDKDSKTKEMLKARAIGMEQEEEKDFQLKIAYDVPINVSVGGGGVGGAGNEYDDDYDDQVSGAHVCIYTLMLLVI